MHDNSPIWVFSGTSTLKEGQGLAKPERNSEKKLNKGCQLINKKSVTTKHCKVQQLYISIQGLAKPERNFYFHKGCQ